MKEERGEVRAGANKPQLVLEGNLTCDASGSLCKLLQINRERCTVCCPCIAVGEMLLTASSTPGGCDLTLQSALFRSTPLNSPVRKGTDLGDFRMFMALLTNASSPLNRHVLVCCARDVRMSSFTEAATQMWPGHGGVTGFPGAPVPAPPGQPCTASWDNTV